MDFLQNVTLVFHVFDFLGSYELAWGPSGKLKWIDASFMLLSRLYYIKDIQKDMTFIILVLNQYWTILYTLFHQLRRKRRGNKV